MTNTNRILFWMSTRDPMTLGEIAEAVSMSNIAVYDSLRLLRNTGFMVREEDGLYAITPKGMARVADRKATEAVREKKRLDAQAKRAPKLSDAARAERSLKRRQSRRKQQGLPMRGQRMEYFAAQSRSPLELAWAVGMQG